MGDKEEENEVLTTVVLRLSAHNLPRRGIRMIIPDSYAVVTTVAGPYDSTEPVDKSEHFVGRTEV